MIANSSTAVQQARKCDRKSRIDRQRKSRNDKLSPQSSLPLALHKLDYRPVQRPRQQSAFVIQLLPGVNYDNFRFFHWLKKTVSQTIAIFLCCNPIHMRIQSTLGCQCPQFQFARQLTVPCEINANAMRIVGRENVLARNNNLQRTSDVEDAPRS
jgi:hypothetical protein